ncbi:uncharacterized protein J3R85_012549 [Psidium guajava]|nr:uncharacterized protein J3R85_012549 [Psidium guajava]
MIRSEFEKTIATCSRLPGISNEKSSNTGLDYWLIRRFVTQSGDGDRLPFDAGFSPSVPCVSVVVPSTNCYALDNSSHLVDFSSWIGHVFEYDWKGFVDFGRFNKFNYFTAGLGHINFVQRFYNGDLRNCEKIYDKLGRTSQVNIICGSCSKSKCKDPLGCICDVTYESPCRVLVERAIPCEKQGPRVFEGFTVGFHPQSWEIVYNGLTQPGFEKSYPDFSFRREQGHVALYMTAISSHSNLVQKPVVKVFPEKGLDVKLSGSAMAGRYPTTLSPTTLILDWRCETPHDSPYEVGITVPGDGYEPVHFTLSKICEHRQDTGGDAIQGWAVFGFYLACTIILTLEKVPTSTGQVQSVVELKKMATADSEQPQELCRGGQGYAVCHGLRDGHCDGGAVSVSTVGAPLIPGFLLVLPKPSFEALK